MHIFQLRLSPGRVFLLFLLLIGMILLSLIWQDVQESLDAMAPALFGQVILIDAGHGGYDPGVLAADGSREADINLSIAKKLEEYCRQGGMTVMMSRSSDEALANTKGEDMKSRVSLAETADIFVSLHCNSYLGSNAQRGAQVFYQRGNEAGKLLAEGVQGRFKQELANTERTALPHPDSYLLKNIEAPAIIAEMGFLSNQEEAELLQNEAYQWKIAWAIYQALNEFFSMEELLPQPQEQPTELGNPAEASPHRCASSKPIMQKSLYPSGYRLFVRIREN